MNIAEILGGHGGKTGSSTGKTPMQDPGEEGGGNFADAFAASQAETAEPLVEPEVAFVGDPEDQVATPMLHAGAQAEPVNPDILPAAQVAALTDPAAQMPATGSASVTAQSGSAHQAEPVVQTGMEQQTALVIGRPGLPLLERIKEGGFPERQSSNTASQGLIANATASKLSVAVASTGITTATSVTRDPEPFQPETEAVSLRNESPRGTIPSGTVSKTVGAAAQATQATSASALASSLVPNPFAAVNSEQMLALFGEQADIQLTSVHDPRLPGGQSISQGLTSVVSAPQKAIAHQITAALSKPHDGSIQIRLDPPELGRISLQLTPSDGGMIASVSADRPEVLDLMRRHESLLNSELEDAGYSDLSFEFAEQEAGDAESENTESEGRHLVLAESEHDAESTNTAARPSHDGQSLDIRL